MTERGDNFCLVVFSLAMILWLICVPFIPQEYSFLYLLLLVFLWPPFLYLLHLKRQIYQWSREAVFYLFFLIFLGVLAFAHAILGLFPIRLFQSQITLFLKLF